MNVALGGSLIQDIETQIPGSLTHRNWDIYDQNFHQIELSGHLQKTFGIKSAKVNSVHHQAVKELGRGLSIEATSGKDKVIEAIRWTGGPEYAVAVQWHPEFQDPSDKSLLSSTPLLNDFLSAVEERRTSKG